MKENTTLLYDTNEKPTPGKWFILAIQHVFAMFGATILVPLLVNEAAGTTVLTIPIALVASGIGTLIYILCTKGKSPVYLGSSFAYITPIAVAFAKDGVSGFTTGIIAVGLIYVLFAFLIKLFGKNWVDKLLPPIVIGPMIMIIGLSLAPSAVEQLGLTSGSIEWKSLVVGLVAFLVTAITAVGAKGFFKVIPFLIGIVSGYLVAICLGMVDFTAVAEASFFELPKFLLPGRDYTFSLAGLLTIAPIAVVTIAEHIGDHMALSAIINKDLIKDPGLERTLLGDGLATSVAGFLGAPANTTYGENTSVVGMTKVASVWVIGLAAIIAICIGFLGKLSAIFTTIPNAVLGGVSLLLYGFIAVNGLKVLVKNQINFENTRNVIVASTMLVLGLGGAILTFQSGDISVSFTGMSLAAIVGIILNLTLPKGEEERCEESALAEPIVAVVTKEKSQQKNKSTSKKKTSPKKKN
ncbi:MAG: solute carrier family 23 protein [Mycoplasmatota bacterium]|nr:solute carrier family 23 protein [Mycoplasmatota bacterium]